VEAVVYPSVDGVSGYVGALPNRGRPKIIDVRPAEVGAEINRFVEEIADSVNDRKGHPFVVDEIEMEVTVTAEGKVQLILGSASASGGMTIRVKLTRSE
jgi:hypothetical protein